MLYSQVVFSKNPHVSVCESSENLEALTQKTTRAKRVAFDAQLRLYKAKVFVNYALSQSMQNIQKTEKAYADRSITALKDALIELGHAEREMATFNGQVQGIGDGLHKCLLNQWDKVGLSVPVE